MQKVNFRAEIKRINRATTFQYTKAMVKFILNNRSIKYPIRWYIQAKYQKKQKAASLVRIKNKCLLSRRSRGFYRFAKISRLFLRDNAYIGKLPGLQQAKWG